MYSPSRSTLAALALALAAPAVNLAAAEVTLAWLGDDAPAVPAGITWGVPWPQGQIPPNQTFRLTGANGAALPVQTWPLAYWPDGSLKWSGFATVATPEAGSSFTLATGAPAGTTPGVTATQYANAIDINTGAYVARIPLAGANLVEYFARDNQQFVGAGQLELVLQNGPDGDPENTPARERYVSEVKRVTLEQSGPVRAVVKIEGMHKGVTSGREWLPFVVRLYFFPGDTPVRLVHTIFYDGDQNRDFIRALGVSFKVPFREEIQNRHVRFSGQDGGLWSEPIQPLTGRAGLGGNAYATQLQGERVPNLADLNPQGRNLLAQWAIWSDFRLVQLNASGFMIEKRTGPQSAWIHSASSGRASGLVFVGDVSGGLGLSIRNFWQSYPAELEVRNAAADAAEVTAWVWSPHAPAMDLRHYSDRAHGLDAVYEDVQEGLSTPYGIARTTEFTLFPTAGVPAREDTVLMAQLGEDPPILVATPEYYYAVRAFGIWSLPDRTTPFKAAIEDRLDALLAFYLTQPDERNWYGFWDYGDVMHAFDGQRGVWRYDLGGYAWDNSELGPDMWLWYSYLRTGRKDIYRMAEAMTRHTGEVDSYHFGPMAGLGTRHGVRHWGDGAKEARVAQAAFRRFYYYLTGDERTGDNMREALQADQSVVQFDPMRIARPPIASDAQWPTRIRFGPDWFALAGNWMTEWERTNDPKWRDRILVGANDVLAMPHKMRSGSELIMGFDPATGHLYARSDQRGTYNLTFIMGGAEVMFELVELLDHPEFKQAFVEFTADSGTDISRGRLQAYAAAITKDEALTQQAIASIGGGGGGRGRGGELSGALSLNPVTLGPADTNTAAQSSLNTIQILELLGDSLPTEAPAPRAGGPRGGARGFGRGGAAPPPAQEE